MEYIYEEYIPENALPKSCPESRRGDSSSSILAAAISELNMFVCAFVRATP